jgi:hypothetical protein
MVAILPPACSVPLLEMNMPVPTLEMRNDEAVVGTAETRANTEARIKNMEEKVNLTMVIKGLLVVVERRHAE